MMDGGLNHGQALSSSHLTSKQFDDALLGYIDESKPDSLLKKQMMSLGLEWKQKKRDDAVNTDQKIMVGEEATTNKDHVGGNPASREIAGTLTLSSEYISIFVHVICQWRIQDDVNNTDDSASNNGQLTTDATKMKRPLDERSGCFQNEFYFRLGVSAKTNKSGTNADDEKIQTTNGKNRSMDRKLRSGMIERLCTDQWIRQILVADDADEFIDGKLVCEALIQQNETNTAEGHTKCEQRVNANSGSIEGTRNSILSHCEDNLDMLEFLLNMPYLPRDGALLDTMDFAAKEKEILKTLARRAYLRILEDAMFDACENEGQDDMVDDLNLCDKIIEQDSPHHDDAKQQIGPVKKKNKV